MSLGSWFQTGKYLPFFYKIRETFDTVKKGEYCSHYKFVVNEN